jgi:hypothetical protein
MRKKGFKCSKNTFADSQESYDLKIFHWLQKTFPRDDFFGIQPAFLDNANMLLSNFSEEKLRWLAERGHKDISTIHSLRGLMSIQFALFLEQLEGRPFPVHDDPRSKKGSSI